MKRMKTETTPKLNMSGSMEVHKGGYEMDIFVVKPREEFGCALCSKILKDPHQCTNGHCFCHDCISASLSRIPECPTCNIITSDANLSKNLMLQRIVEQEITFCPSIAASCCDGDKCHWTGPLHSRSSHYESICEFYPMKCSNGGCTETIQRRKMVEHLEYCSFRRVSCPFCPVSNTTTYVANELAKHQQDCIYRPVLCKCSESIPFHLFESHELNNCSRANVPCPRAGLVNCICPNCPGSAERGIILDHIIGKNSNNSNSNSNNNSNITVENDYNGVYQAIQKISQEFDGILNQKSLAFAQEKADLVAENSKLRAELEEYKNKNVTHIVDTNNTGTTAIAESTNTDKSTDNNSNTNSNVNITPPVVETTSAVPLSTEPIKRSSIHHLINKLETSGTTVPVPPQSSLKNSVKIGTSMVLNKKEQKEHQKFDQKLKQNDQNLAQNVVTIPAVEEPTKATVASDVTADTPPATAMETEVAAIDNTAAIVPVETASAVSETTTAATQVDTAPPTTSDATIATTSAATSATIAAAVETTVKNNIHNNNNADDATTAAATDTAGTAEEETENNDNDDDQQESATDGTDNSFSPALSPASRQARRTSKFISDNDMKSLRKQIDNRSEEEKRESQKHEGNKRDHYAKLGSTFVSEKVLSTAPGSGPGGAGRGRGAGRGGGIR